MHNESSSELRREEIRGLFVLGLLAVLVSLRFRYNELTITLKFIEEYTFDIMPLLDLTIFSWSFYAFFMVLGLSKDVIGMTFEEMFRGLSKTCLLLDFILLGLFAFAFYYRIFPTRLPLLLILLLIVIISEIIHRARKMEKSLKHALKFGLLEVIKSNLQAMLTILTILSIAAFLLTPYEQWVFPLFLVSCVGMIILLIIEVKTRKK